jgi:predicted ester cyclase
VKVNVNMCVKLAAGLIVLAMLNTPAAWPQNPAPATVQNPTAAAQSPGSAAPAAGQQAAPQPEYPLLPGAGSADAMPRRYIQLWDTGDFRLLTGMFIDHPRLHYPGMDSLAMPPSLVARRVAIWRNCLPDLKYQILDTIVQGDRIAMRAVYTGTYTRQCFNDVPGPVAGAEPEKVKINEMLIFGMEQGKIADIWEQYDQLGARLQMGATWCNATEPAAAGPAAQPPHAASPNSPPSSPAPASPPSSPAPASPSKP